MGSIGPAEIVVVLIIGLIVLGPNRLPEAARQIGKAMNEFRRVSSGLQAEVRDAFAEPVPGTPSVPPAPTSAAVATEAESMAGTEGITEVAAHTTQDPAPWANPALPVEGPPPNVNGSGSGSGH